MKVSRSSRTLRRTVGAFVVVFVLIICTALWFASPTQLTQLGRSYPATFSCSGSPIGIRNVAGGDWQPDDPFTPDEQSLWNELSSGPVQGTLKVTGTTPLGYSAFHLTPRASFWTKLRPKRVLTGTFTPSGGTSIRVSQNINGELICGVRDVAR